MGGGGQLALNQLLVVMDGIGNPPFFKKLQRNRFNTFLDATYVIPRADRTLLAAAAGRRGRAASRSTSSAPATCRSSRSTRRSRARAGSAATSGSGRRPSRTGSTSSTSTSTRSRTARTSTRRRRRDEIARVTNGYSPAMIEQVCSMALTIAHHDGRPGFEFEDLFEAMTTVESGTAINIEYVPDETRAVAIHEAGHAVASHVFMKDTESTRLSIRMRGQSLGHHQALEKEERFSKWRSEQMAALIWTLGAMAAERVFYDENSTGVGGDVQSATARAAFMVGASAMGPERIELNGGFKTDEDARRGAREDHEALRGDRAADHEPHRRRAVRARSDLRRAGRSGQAQGGRADPRAGLREGVQPDPAQQGRRLAHRRRRRRAPGDLRRRAARPAARTRS